MEALTGGRVMDASAIREYFKPLETWLIEDNKKHGEFVGWETGKDEPRQSCRLPVEAGLWSQTSKHPTGTLPLTATP